MLNKVIEILLSAILLIPIFWVLHKSRFHSIPKTVRYFVFAVYLSAVYLFVGMPTLQFLRFEVSFTLVPFLPMITDLKNTLLNILLFVPLGLLLPFLWTKYKTGKATCLFGFGMSLSIELLQIFTYRATDVNDIIANTLGTLLGYLLFRVISRLIPSVTGAAGRKNDVSVILFYVFGVMFFLQPYLAALYYKFT